MRSGSQKATAARRLIRFRSFGASRPRSRPLTALVAASLFLLTACRAELDVMVDVEEDGSGVVRAEMTLDREASEALLDPALALTDLAQSGWEIGRPEQDSTGSTILTAQKPFGTPEQFSEVMDELAHSGGVIQDFGLRRDQSFGRVDYAVSGMLDPSGGLASFGDAELDETLGRPLTELITSPPYNVTEDDITVRVSVVLPGDLQGDAGGAVEGEPVQPQGNWEVDLSADQPVEVALASTRRSTSAQVLRGVAVVAGVLAALIAFGQLLRIISSLRRPGTKRPNRPTDARGRPTEAQHPAPAPEEPEVLEPKASGYRVVALDGQGVLYKEGRYVRELLIPFAREYGSTVPDEEIEAKLRLLTLGRLTTGDFWAAIGVTGDPHELDSIYVSRHQLMPGVVKYLRSIRDIGLRVACITDDSPAWAMKLRAAHSLEALIDPWVISGSVGVRKPDPPLFEVLRRMTGEPASAILVVDDDLDNLDVARDLGFGTAWFSPDGERSEARSHDLFRNFDVATDVAAAATATGDVPPPETAPGG